MPSVNNSSTRHGAQASCSAGPSSHPTALLPAWAHSGLAAQISQPGLASRLDARPAADRFNDLPANDAPEPDESMPDGWSDPGWPSDDSMWAQMRGPDDPPKVLSKKRKKRNIKYQSCGLLAVHEQVTRDYLTRSSTHTVDDEALTVEIWSARRAFTQKQAELAKTVVTPTPQFVELPLLAKYLGEGEPLPHGDPPIPVTGCLPRPLGRSAPRTADWVDVCPLDNIHFLELHELSKKNSSCGTYAGDDHHLPMRPSTAICRQSQAKQVWDWSWHHQGHHCHAPELATQSRGRPSSNSRRTGWGPQHV
jgi:hypothetical protein